MLGFRPKAARNFAARPVIGHRETNDDATHRADAQRAGNLKVLMLCPDESALWVYETAA
jgi:hypothetical protein